MKLNLMLIIIVFSFTNLISQEKTNIYTPKSKSLSDFDWEKNRIGFTYSMMTGYGLTYLRQFDNGIALKGQLFAYGSIDDEENYRNEIDVAFGIEVQYNIKKFDKTRL